METVLVIGLGEVGRPVYKIIEDSGNYTVYGIDKNKALMKKLNQGRIPKQIDIMHICIPCFDAKKFIGIVSEYAKKYKPYLLIINSTVPPQTTKRLGKKCVCALVHSPTFGTHKSKEYMEWEVKRWTKLIGGIDKESSEMAREHFWKIGIRTQIVKSPTESELVKIFETTYAGWMITFFQEFHRIAEVFGADFSEIVGRIAEIHKTTNDKPVWYPDVIGGHCIIQNIDLLLSCYDADFLRLIKTSNEKRKVEVKKEKTKHEIAKIKEQYKRERENV